LNWLRLTQVNLLNPRSELWDYDKRKSKQIMKPQSIDNAMLLTIIGPEILETGEEYWAFQSTQY